MVVTSHPGPAFPGFSASPIRIEDGISESLRDVHNFVADFRRKREKKSHRAFYSAISPILKGADNFRADFFF